MSGVATAGKVAVVATIEGVGAIDGSETVSVTKGRLALSELLRVAATTAVSPDGDVALAGENVEAPGTTLAVVAEPDVSVDGVKAADVVEVAITVLTVGGYGAETFAVVEDESTVLNALRDCVNAVDAPEGDVAITGDDDIVLGVTTDGASAVGLTTACAAAEGSTTTTGPTGAELGSAVDVASIAADGDGGGAFPPI